MVWQGVESDSNRHSRQTRQHVQYLLIFRWDIREIGKKPSITKQAHNGEVYSVDLNKFSAYLMLSGGEDSDINLWDTRNMSKHLHKFIGHNDSITKVQWSTINPYSFTSSSFDRRIVTWNMKKINNV